MGSKAHPRRCRQTGCSFWTGRRLEGLDPHDTGRIISALAQIQMQAAGLDVEELDDDKR
jgi:hypothetical protein